MKNITSYVMIALAMMALLFPACVQGVTTLAAGSLHVVQMDKDMVLWTWGGNAVGQLALGHNANQPSPAPVALAPTISDPVSVCAGLKHTCILDSNKNVACSGLDIDGQIGEGTSRSSFVCIRLLLVDVHWFTLISLLRLVLTLNNRFRWYGGVELIVGENLLLSRISLQLAGILTFCPQSFCNRLS
jgi:hypothetical protein